MKTKTDTQEITNKNTSREERLKLNVGDIWANQVRCKKCKQVIRSKNRHDMVYCKCGAIFVDGGSWYLRRGGDLNMIEELSEKYTRLE